VCDEPAATSKARCSAGPTSDSPPSCSVPPSGDESVRSTTKESSGDVARSFPEVESAPASVLKPAGPSAAPCLFALEPGSRSWRPHAASARSTRTEYFIRVAASPWGDEYCERPRKTGPLLV
jgi:hypothetical protein